MSSIFTNLRPITLATLVAGLVLAFTVPQLANAQVNVVVNGGSGTNAQRQVVTLNSQIRDYLQQLVTKEYELDPNASDAARQAALQYYEETKAFIASGDAGNPFFVDNLELYRASIRATTTNNTINELQESQMCEAFKNDVIQRLKQLYVQDNARTVAQKNTCQLQQADEDYQKFLQGEFEEDSIQALYAIIRNPSNTPLGSLLANQALVEQQAEEAEQNALLRLQYGDGFKDQYAAGQNVMVCTQTEQNGIRDNCRISTPAEAVRLRAAALNTIETSLKTDADEIREPEANAVINQAIQQTVITGITGTANNAPNASSTTPGTGGGTGTGGNPTTPGGATIVNPNPGTNLADPIPQVPNDSRQPATINFLAEVSTTINDSPASSTNPIRPVLIRTLTKLQYQLETVALIDQTENRYIDTSENADYTRLACYSQTFPNNFSNDRTLTLTEIPFTIDAIKRLYVLYIQYEVAVANNQPVAPIITEFNALLQNNFAIPTAVDLADIADKYNNFTSDQIGSFENNRLQQVAACERLLRLENCQQNNLSCDSNGNPTNNNNGGP